MIGCEFECSPELEPLLPPPPPNLIIDLPTGPLELPYTGADLIFLAITVGILLLVGICILASVRAGRR